MYELLCRNSDENSGQIPLAQFPSHIQTDIYVNNAAIVI